MTQSAGKLLSGLRVVDLGVGLAPGIVANLLADNGASVVRMDAGKADPLEASYPILSVWRASAGVERRDAADPDALEQALAAADIAVLGGEDHPAIQRRRDGADLVARHKRLIALQIDGGPAGTPHDSQPTTDLLAQARTGLCYEHFSDRPICMAFEPANYGAALQGLCGVLGALVERESSGLGQLVRTSLFEGALTWVSQLWAGFESPTRSSRIVQPKDPHPLILQCADGVWIHLVLGASGSKYHAYQALGIDDPTVVPGDSGMPDPGAAPRNFYGDIDLLRAHAGRIGSEELLEALWSRNVPVEPVLAPGACWDLEQAKTNALTVTGADGIRRVNHGFLADIRHGPAAPPAARGDPAQAPLQGVRVVDFGAFVAGPLASVVLSDLGADVVKAEPPSADPARAMLRSFMAANRGKRGITLDLKTPEGLRIARRLILEADVVTSNFRSGVSERLGIDPPALHASKPSLVVLESPGYGATGPMAKKGAFDPLMQAFCGHEARGAGAGNAPFWNRSFMVDFAGGIIGGIAVLAGLYHRRRTGEGVGLTAPLLNAGAFLLSELIQDGDGRFRGCPGLNAGRTGYRPAEAFYQTADGWIAIVVRSEAQATALAEVLNLADRLGGAFGGWRDAEADAIGEALARLGTDEAVGALRGAGIWAEPCRKDMENRILHDPDLRARGAVRRSLHPTLGEVLEIGTLFSLSRSKTGSDRPIFELGEHDAEVRRELLPEPAEAPI